MLVEWLRAEGMQSSRIWANQGGKCWGNRFHASQVRNNSPSLTHRALPELHNSAQDAPDLGSVSDLEQGLCYRDKRAALGQGRPNGAQQRGFCFYSRAKRIKISAVNGGETALL